MPNPVVHFEIIGSDGEALQKFYANLFDWNVDANNDMKYGIVAKEEEGIGGGISAAMPGGPPNMVTFYVQVDDIDIHLKKAEELGGKTVLPKMDVPGGPTIGMFQDISGNVIGLVEAAAQS